MIVAIGLPVRNGMPYLEESIDALLAQTYRSLEIVVCDNASTDSTPEYCRQIAAADARVTYIRHAQDVGASENFNRAFRATTAPLFSWAAHDDRFRPRYVEACIAELAAREDCVMAVPAVQFINEYGAPLGELHERTELASADVRVRARAYLDRHEWFSIYGVARRSVLERSTLLTPDFGPDVVLMWQMILAGPVCVVDDVLVEYRRYTAKTVASVMQGLVPSAVVPSLRFPHLGMWLRLWRAAARADAAAATAGRRALVWWLPSSHFRDLVFEDLRLEVQRATARRRWPSAVVAGVLMVAVRPTRIARRVMRIDRSTTSPPDRAR